MSGIIECLSRPSDGLARIEFYGIVSLWNRCQLRSTKRCELCDKLFNERSFMYRPLINTKYRGKRLCASCVEGSK